jgi:hypothetical protein
VITRTVNRQYDDSFAVEGAKIGSTLRIRLPDRALVTDGAALRAVLLAHLFKKRDVVMAQLAERRSQPLAGKGAQA